MGLKEFLTSASRLMKSISKPDRRTFWLSIKVCLMGIALIGGLGYLIRLIAVTLQGI
jgi:protein translocase SEC61 complex gamma subunit